MSTKNKQDNDRARRTLYVTGFNSKRTSKRLLEELFTQGAPIVDITMFDSHAYVLFQHEESVPYCLALFNEIELNGEKLRLNPRCKTNDAFCYLKYLNVVREKIRSEYMKIPPPDLPPKKQVAKQQKRTSINHQSNSRHTNTKRSNIQHKNTKQSRNRNKVKSKKKIKKSR